MNHGGRTDPVRPANKATRAAREQEGIRPGIQEDGQELQHLLSQYSPRLFRTALRQLGNTDDANDAVQDALLSAVKHIAEFEGRCHISTWLIRIVMNSAGMQLRRRHRHETISLDQISEPENSGLADRLIDDGPNPEEICGQTELREVLHKLMEQLSPALCRAFELREIYGLSTLEAAQALGTTESAVKSQLLRARAKLTLLLRHALGPTGALKSRAVAGAAGVAW